MAVPARAPQAPYNPQPAYGRDYNHPLWGRVDVQRMPLVRTQEQPPSAHLAQHQATSNDAENLSVAYLYDIVDYPTTGLNQFNFFGRSQNAAGLNATDTNMQQPGNVGAGVRFLVEHMWIDFIPGAPMVSAGVEASIAATNAYADYSKVMQGRGAFQFYVNLTPQVGYGISPLKYAASPVVIGVDGGVGAGVAALEALAPNTKNAGYNTSQFPFWLEETMSFSAQIVFPALITVTTLSRIGVILKGRQVRRAS